MSMTKTSEEIEKLRRGGALVLLSIFLGAGCSAPSASLVERVNQLTNAPISNERVAKMWIEAFADAAEVHDRELMKRLATKYMGSVVFDIDILPDNLLDSLVTPLRQCRFVSKTENIEYYYFLCPDEDFPVAVMYPEDKKGVSF